VDKIIEVRYAGAVVSRSAVVRDLDARGLFIGLTEPLPVGTEVTLALGGDAVPAKVASVFESQELTRAGMRVVFGDSSSSELFRAIADATPAAEAPSASLSGSSGSGRVVAPASGSRSGASSGAGSARVVAPAAAVSSAPVQESRVAAPVPVSVPSSAPVAATSSPPVTTLPTSGGAAAVSPVVSPSPKIAAQVDAEPASPADAADDVDASGPVTSGDGGNRGGASGTGGGAPGGGGGGGGRRNRRNRRR